MHFFAISGLLVAISNFLMAVWVYLKGRNKKTNILWALFIIAASIWGFGGYKFTTTLNKIDVFLWLRIAYIGVIFIPVLFCHFVYAFLDVKRKKIIIALYLITILFIIFNFFSKKLFLGEPAIIFSSFYWVTSPGPIWFLFLTYFISLVVYSEYKLFKEYRISFGSRRNQLRYVYLATSLGFSSGATCFLPCFGINLYPGFGNIGVALYCMPVAYAIIKYRLMDIRVAITRTGIFIAVYTLLLGLPFLVALQLKNWLVATFAANWWVLPVALMAASATFGPFIYVYFQKRAEAMLMRRQRAYQDTLKQAARELSRIHNLKKLLHLIVHIVTKTVGITHAAIYLFDKEAQEFSLRATRNVKNGVLPFTISQSNPLVEWLKTQKEILVYEDVYRKTNENPASDFNALKEQMQSLDAAVIVSGLLKDELIGFLVLGNRRSGEFYTAQDIDTLSVIAHQAALAIENAFLYENMEEQIRQRTKELMEVQRQLIQAEKLATVGTLAGGVAHEINNPLTAILTNVQMLLTINNQIDSDSKESLQLIEEATRRCRTIVQKLMTYAKKPLEPTKIEEVDLSKVVKNVVSFLEYHLEQDNIKIIVEAKEDGYLVMGNQNELEQVVMNIVLNARDAIRKIRKSGKIYITLLKSGDWIKIEIKDEGVGIPKEIMPKIFDPFFTTKEVGKGTGLGLSICQSIVEKHNGLITIQSELNRGSVFTVQLPKAGTRSSIDKVEMSNRKKIA